MRQAGGRGANDGATTHEKDELRDRQGPESFWKTGSVSLGSGVKAERKQEGRGGLCAGHERMLGIFQKKNTKNEKRV